MKWSGFAVWWLVLSLCVLYVFLKEVLFATLGNYDELMQHADGSGLSPLLRGSGVQRTEEVKAMLSKFADAALSLGPQASRDCGKGDNRKVVVRGMQYGQFSNNMISLVHGLGFTEALNRHYHESGEDIRYSFVVPNYMARMMHPFDLSALHAQYCFYVQETPGADEEADQMPVFGLATLFSTEKTLSEKWGKFAAYAWSIINYAPSNIRKEVEVVHGLKGTRGLQQQQQQRSSMWAGGGVMFDPTFGAHDVRIESKMLFFWGQKAAISWRQQKFPFLFPDQVSSNNNTTTTRGVMITPNTTSSSSSSSSSNDAAELVQHETRHYTRTYLAVLGSLYGHTAPSVEKGALMMLDMFSPIIGAGSISNSSSSSSGGLSYSAAHRRDLDGECEATMRANSVWDRDFRGLVDLREQEYEYKAGENPYPHPLCSMPAHFVHAVVKREREGQGVMPQPIYISSDCKTDREDQHWLNYRGSNDPSASPSVPTSLFSSNFVVGRRMRGLLGLGQLLTPSEQSCIDILLCALGTGVFIGNPRSTFTFQIIALRAILKLKSLPEVVHHDMYFTPVGEGEGEGAFSGTWVSSRSIHAVLNE